MALYYELQVFKDVYTLVQKVFLYTQEFPREYKYTLGQDMKRDAIQLVRSINIGFVGSQNLKENCEIYR